MKKLAIALFLCLFALLPVSSIAKAQTTMTTNGENSPILLTDQQVPETEPAPTSQDQQYRALKNEVAGLKREIFQLQISTLSIILILAGLILQVSRLKQDG